MQKTHERGKWYRRWNEVWCETKCVTNTFNQVGKKYANSCNILQLAILQGINGAD